MHSKRFATRRHFTCSIQRDIFTTSQYASIIKPVVDWFSDFINILCCVNWHFKKLPSIIISEIVKKSYSPKRKKKIVLMTIITSWFTFDKFFSCQNRNKGIFANSQGSCVSQRCNHKTIQCCCRKKTKGRVDDENHQTICLNCLKRILSKGFGIEGSS